MQPIKPYLFVKFNLAINKYISNSHHKPYRQQIKDLSKICEEYSEKAGNHEKMKIEGRYLIECFYLSVEFNDMETIYEKIYRNATVDNSEKILLMISYIDQMIELKKESKLLSVYNHLCREIDGLNIPADIQNRIDEISEKINAIE